MGQVASNPSSYTFVQAYNEYGWKSLNDSTLLKPQVYNEILLQNGGGERMLDFLRLMKDGEYSMSRRSLDIISEGQRERVLTSTNAISVGTAGAQISFTVTPDNSGTINGIWVQVGDTIIIPGDYQTDGEDHEYYVDGVTGTATKTITATPLNSSGRIGTEVPIGTEFVVGGNKNGWGTGQPEGKVDVKQKRTYYAELSKASIEIEGGIDALEWWVEKGQDGKNSVMFESQANLEFDLDRQLDFKLFFSELNTNSISVASQAGGSNLLPSTKGLWQHGKDEGMSQTYGGAYTVSYMYDLKDFLRSKNVTSRDLMYGYGTDLGRQIHEAVKDEIREYSGGTDLFKKADTYGFDVKYINVNGMNIALKEFDSFSNPTKFGNNNLKYRQNGIVMPIGTEKVSVNGKSSVKPMIMMGYARNNGVDRSRVLRFIDGMTGSTGMASNQNDVASLNALSEHTTIVTHPEQLILIEKV